MASADAQRPRTRTSPVAAPEGSHSTASIFRPCGSAGIVSISWRDGGRPPGVYQLCSGAVTPAEQDQDAGQDGHEAAGDDRLGQQRRAVLAPEGPLDPR